MIIRTKDEFYKQLCSSDKYSDYLPIVKARHLPMILHKLKLKLKDHDTCKKAVSKLNKYLESKDQYIKGYHSKDRDTDLHQCEVAFEEHVHTFGEDHEGILGKDSIGIHFTDPDDNWNDWIWISYEVLHELATNSYQTYLSNASCEDPVPDPPKPILKKGFRIVRFEKSDVVWFEVQKRNWFGIWKYAIYDCNFNIGTSYSCSARKFNSFEEALAAYHYNFDDAIVEVMTEEGD